MPLLYFLQACKAEREHQLLLLAFTQSNGKICLAIGEVGNLIRAVADVFFGVLLFITKCTICHQKNLSLWVKEILILLPNNCLQKHLWTLWDLFLLFFRERCSQHFISRAKVGRECSFSLTERLLFAFPLYRSYGWTFTLYQSFLESSFKFRGRFIKRTKWLMKVFWKHTITNTISPWDFKFCLFIPWLIAYAICLW